MKSLLIKIFSIKLITILMLLISDSAMAIQLNMKQFAVVDQQMNGIPAFRILAPSNWQLNGGLTWNHNLVNLVTANIAITAPDKSAGFYVHPSPMFISGQIQYQWQQGQLYLGMIVMPMPNSPTEFIQQIVIPEQRPHATNLKLIQEEDLSSWAANIAATTAQSGNMPQGFGVRARFAYTENGKKWEEDFYCAILVSRAGPQNMFWLADRNLSVRTEVGKLNSIQPLANAFVNSFRLEKRWYGHFLQIQQQWIAAQQRGIASAGALSDAISKSNDQFNQSMMQSWNARQQSEDRANREFSEYIRGSENYNDTVNGTNVELPGGYAHTWTNTQGEYILTDDAGFNPNRNSNLNWETIRPLR